MSTKPVVDFSEFFAHATDLLYVADAGGTLVKVNPAFKKTLGWNPKDLEGTSLMDIVHPEEREAMNSEHREAGKNNGGVSFKHRLKDKRRKNYRQCEGKAFSSAGGNVVYGLMKDITEKELMQQQLQASLIHDDLTGLYNKQGFFIFGESYLHLVPRQRKVLALMRLEIDRLSEIETSLGGPAADSACTSLANILRNIFRKSDIISRIGPNTFCVLGLVNHEDEIANLGNRINVSIENFNREKPYSFDLSVRISTAVSGPGGGISLEELLDKLYA